MRNLQGPSRQQAGGRGPAQRRERPGLALAVSGPGRLARPPATTACATVGQGEAPGWNQTQRNPTGAARKLPTG